MMMEAIYDGTFRPDETDASESPRCWKLSKEVRSLQEELKSRLELDDYLVVEQLLDQYSLLNREESRTAFCTGLSAGLLLLQEAHTMGEKQSEFF